MMSRYVWTLGVAVLSQVLYHLGQRAVPRSAPPLQVLAFAYAGAFAMCLVSLFFVGRPSRLADLSVSVGWSTWLITLSIFGIEIGYLLAYRSGWTISVAFGVASTMTVVILAMIGMTLLGDPVTERRLLGLAFACLGLWLIV
jgi:drug/metabolite transporter (DMT)-like permease